MLNNNKPYPMKLYASSSKGSKGYSVRKFVLNKAVIVSEKDKESSINMKPLNYTSSLNIV